MFIMFIFVHYVHVHVHVHVHYVHFWSSFVSYQEKDMYKIDSTADTDNHHKIQQNLELVLLCISVAAVILSLILLTTIR